MSYLSTRDGGPSFPTSPTQTFPGVVIATSNTNLNTIPYGPNGTSLNMVAGVPTFSAPVSSGWGLTGNAGTNITNNYIGTSDNVDVGFRRNNVAYMRFIASGTSLVQIGAGSAVGTAISSGVSIDNQGVYAGGITTTTTSALLTSFGTVVYTGSTTGNIFSLSSPGANQTRRMYRLFNSGTTDITLNGHINGTASTNLILPPGCHAFIQSNGTTWYTMTSVNTTQGRVSIAGLTSITISTSAVKATNPIITQLEIPGGGFIAHTISARTAGTSFTVDFGGVTLPANSFINYVIY